jgi:putative pyruvate formate lyase activating enzyme
MTVSRASLHNWEEPIISGTNGSGTIFFSGCSLGCVFCQNREISRGASVGKEITEERLAEIMSDLEARGAHNINFVTPTHFAPSIRSGIKIARSRGLKIPIVYNTSSYDSVDALGTLNQAVDIYLADFKYYLDSTAKRLSFAANYPNVCKAAIEEMVRQRPAPVIENGIMKSGVIVRILLLPSHLAEAKLTVKYLFDTYGDSIYISLMSQYTPFGDMEPPLNRRVTRREYDELCGYALRLGVKNAFIQERESVGESFIPKFDNTGV